jgi:hypothetical protein
VELLSREIKGNGIGSMTPQKRRTDLALTGRIFCCRCGRTFNYKEKESIRGSGKRLCTSFAKELKSLSKTNQETQTEMEKVEDKLECLACFLVAQTFCDLALEIPKSVPRDNENWREEEEGYAPMEIIDNYAEDCVMSMDEFLGKIVLVDVLFNKKLNYFGSRNRRGFNVL